MSDTTPHTPTAGQGDRNERRRNAPVIDSSGGHEFVDPTGWGSDIPGVFCRRCLSMRRADGKNSPCKGPAVISLREMAKADDNQPLSVGGSSPLPPAGGEQQDGKRDQRMAAILQAAWQVVDKFGASDRDAESAAVRALFDAFQIPENAPIHEVEQWLRDTGIDTSRAIQRVQSALRDRLERQLEDAKSIVVKLDREKASLAARVAALESLCRRVVTAWHDDPRYLSPIVDEIAAALASSSPAGESTRKAGQP